MKKKTIVILLLSILSLTGCSNPDTENIKDIRTEETLTSEFETNEILEEKSTQVHN